MNDAYEDAIKEAFVLAPSTDVIFNTLEVRQDGVQDSVFLVQNPVAVVALDENGISRTFNPSGFKFTLPSSSEDGYTTLNVAIDNVMRRASDFVQTAMKSSLVPVKVIYRPYLQSDLTRPQMNPPIVLFLKDVQITSSQVLGTCTFQDLINKKFPVELYARERFPALG